MKILTINSGSSSLKYKVFDMPTEVPLASGLVERIGEAQGARYTYVAGPVRLSGKVDAPDHEAALNDMVEHLVNPRDGVIRSVEEIDAVGHRVVHGGKNFVDAVEITDEVITTVEKLSPLAPLHNPPNLAGIRAARKHFSSVPHVAVFDTAFHQTIPPYAFHYGIPYGFYDKFDVRRYGFHGTSYRYVTRRAANTLGKSTSEFSGIICHLGNGCSIAAVQNGISVDTTMGLTPLEGLLMGTRSGDIDPGVILFLTRNASVPFEKLDDLLNKQSGMLGVSGVSNDVRTLWKAANEGNKRALLALEMFAYRVKKYIGAYLAVLNGCDAIVFTGGIGDKDFLLREKICRKMDSLGIFLDAKHNAETVGRTAIISKPESRVTILVIPTNEELEIARETALFGRKGKVNEGEVSVHRPISAHRPKKIRDNLRGKFKR